MQPIPKKDKKHILVISLIIVSLVSMVALPGIHPAWAEWEVRGEGNLYGTEDVADTTIALQVIPPEGLTAWVTPDSSVIRRRQ